MDQKTIREILGQFIEDKTVLEESDGLTTEWSISQGKTLKVLDQLTNAGHLDSSTAGQIRDILDRVSEAEHTPSQLLDNRYMLAEQLGEGGQGMVYRARDLYLDRDVAIKRLTRLGDRATQRMLQEARNLYQVTHPSIVRELGFGIAQGTGEPYLVLEFLDGPTLTDWINTQDASRIGPDQALDVLCPIVEAVSLLHEAGIIHRDLKPSNILLATREGEQQQRAFLIDLGGAHVKTADLTQTGEVIGTIRYMAPEQALAGKITPATDIYGIGGVLYRLMTGFPPHHGANQAECVDHLLKGQIIAPRRRVPGLDKGIEEILLKCLALDPADRYPSGSALHEELQRYRQGEPLEVKLPGPKRRLDRWLTARCIDHPGLLSKTVNLLGLGRSYPPGANDQQIDQAAMQATIRTQHDQVQERMTTLLESAHSCLRGLGREVSSGLVPLDRTPFRAADSHRDALAQRLLELLGDWPKFSWVSFSNDHGDYIGAYHVAEPEAFWLNKSYLTAEGKTELHQFSAASSTILPAENPTLKLAEAYDPRQRPFYELAISKPGIHWTEPYPFWEGRPGITCTTSIPGRYDDVIGVLTVGLKTVQLVPAVRGDETHSIVVFTQKNQVVALSPETLLGRSKKLIAGSGSDALLVTIDEVPAPLIQAFAEALGSDRSPRELDFVHKRTQYRASLRSSEAGGLPLHVGIILPTKG